MSTKIVVAGGGHGGIAAAALMAKAGLDVTVYEKNSANNMGYDWTDIFAPDALECIGLDMPDDDLFEYKTDMTFYSTNEKTPIYQDVPIDEREIKMERSDIYKVIIDHAVSCGVKFEYNYIVEGPITEGTRVVGIKTDKGDVYADLVIDACGCESAVRRNLPKNWRVQKSPRQNEKFYVYRAFYNKVDGFTADDKYKVCLLPEGKTGIGWVASEDEYTDLLIGRFIPFDLKEAQRTADVFRKNNPTLGTEIVRGGQFVQIPVRQPLSIMVCDGYAAIGDSAFMTVPIIGSGIANSFKAAKILAETVIGDTAHEYSAKTLWDYQYRFYKELGAGLAPLAVVKLLLTQLTPEQLDYIFDNGILTSKEMTITAKSTGLWDFFHLSPDLPKRGLAAIKDKELVKELLWVVKKIALVVTTCARIPKKYDRAAVLGWAWKYDQIFR
ncbi:MAG: NAD(P)/FAD-dependent oxidoreductase [Clostridia bacterium]|nr:NAD(P)/FAD-dependent oxidoreductase [Clostridia bacterium]